MLISVLALISALSLSSVSAYYSIVGLMAIFAAATTPILIMGGTLEVAKIITTLWLHYNWERADLKIRVYLVSAVCVLMLITSLGSFGFLSKAHLEQAVPSGDVQAQVALFDEKIKTQRDNIESDRKALAQLDAAVDQTMARTDTEQGATKSANLRQSQKKDRARYQASIDEAQKLITKLQEERSPVASKLRKVEAEVGPIKYIAALIYGDKTDQNMLESAVRWVIIIIVLVFDPLAIILLLAATTSIDWSKLDRKKKTAELLGEEITVVKLEHDETLTLLKAQHADELALIAKETRAAVEAEFEPLIEAEHQRVVEIQQIVVQQQDLVAANSELMNAQNAKLGDLDVAVRSMADDLDSAREQLSIVTDQKESCETRIDELIESIASLNEDLELDRTAIEELAAKCDSLTEHDDNQSEQLRELVQQYSALFDIKNKLEAALAAEKNTSSELSIVVAERNAEIERLMIELAARMADIEQLLKDLEEARKPAPVIELPKIEEEQPVSGTLTDPVVAEKALEAVFADRPEYFVPKVEEPAPVADWVEQETTQHDAELAEAVASILEPAPVEPSFASSLVTDAQAEPAAPVSVPVKPAAPVVTRPPKLSAVPDNFPLGGNASFGTAFPTNPIKGDLFLRVDYMPSKLFKWVGSRWIEMDKAMSDSYAYDQEYIKLLIDKVNTGEYDIDDLSDMEQDQIAEYLKTH